jgi:hypothetical protein
VKASIVVSPVRTLREGPRHCQQMTHRLASGGELTGVRVPPIGTHMPENGCYPGASPGEADGIPDRTSEGFGIRHVGWVGDGTRTGPRGPGPRERGCPCREPALTAARPSEPWLPRLKSRNSRARRSAEGPNPAGETSGTEAPSPVEAPSWADSVCRAVASRLPGLDAGGAGSGASLGAGAGAAQSAPHGCGVRAPRPADAPPWCDRRATSPAPPQSSATTGCARHSARRDTGRPGHDRAERTVR